MGYQFNPYRGVTTRLSAEVDPDDWVASALCRQFDPELWFSTSTSEAARDAISVCGKCPVTMECLSKALKEEESRAIGSSRYGIRGGLHPNQRTILQKKIGV